MSTPITPIDISSLIEQIQALFNSLIPLIMYIVVLMALVSAMKPTRKEEVETRKAEVKTAEAQAGR